MSLTVVAGIVLPMRRRSLLAALISLPIALSACTGESKPQDPTAALAKAKATFDTAKAVTIDLASSIDIPSGHNGVKGAKGTGIIDATTPKFKGQVTAVVNGTPATVDMVSIGAKSWMSLFTPKLAPVDLADLGAPTPSSFFDPATGLSQMLAKATDARATGEQRYGKEVLQTYAAQLPGSLIKALLRLGKDGTTFDAVFGIEPASGQLRQAKVTGNFYEGISSTYSVVLTDYGKSIDIPRP